MDGNSLQLREILPEAGYGQKIKKECSPTMETNKIEKLMQEVEIYKQAIQDAKDALASAEMELDETLDAEFNQ